MDGLCRFRINLHHERGRAAAAIRALPPKVPRLDELHLPPPVEALSSLTRGLVLIGGPAGSGKTTTLAALIDVINRRTARHVVTIGFANFSYPSVKLRLFTRADRLQSAHMTEVHSVAILHQPQRSAVVAVFRGHNRGVTVAEIDYVE